MGRVGMLSWQLAKNPSPPKYESFFSLISMIRRVGETQPYSTSRNKKHCRPGQSRYRFTRRYKQKRHCPSSPLPPDYSIHCVFLPYIANDSWYPSACPFYWFRHSSLISIVKSTLEDNQHLPPSQTNRYCWWLGTSSLALPHPWSLPQARSMFPADWSFLDLKHNSDI